MSFTVLDNCLSLEGNGSENINIIELQKALTTANRNPAITTVKFTEVYFDFSGISLLKVFLLENKVVDTLEISCNILKNDGLNRVAEGFAGDTLKTLVLRSNFVNVSDVRDVRVFANYLCKSKNLTTLCVRDNNICGGDARLLINILAFNSSIKSLTLKENNYTDSGAKALLDILRSRKNTTLKEVILDSKISPKIAAAISTILRDRKAEQSTASADYRPRNILYSPRSDSAHFVRPKKPETPRENSSTFQPPQSSSQLSQSQQSQQLQPPQPSQVPQVSQSEQQKQTEIPPPQIPPPTTQQQDIPPPEIPPPSTQQDIPPPNIPPPPQQQDIPPPSIPPPSQKQDIPPPEIPPPSTQPDIPPPQPDVPQQTIKPTFVPPPFVFAQQQPAQAVIKPEVGESGEGRQPLYRTYSTHRMFVPNIKGFVPPPFPSLPEQQDAQSAQPAQDLQYTEYADDTEGTPPVPTMPAPPPPIPSAPAPSPPGMLPSQQQQQQEGSNGSGGSADVPVLPPFPMSSGYVGVQQLPPPVRKQY